MHNGVGDTKVERWGLIVSIVPRGCLVFCRSFFLLIAGANNRKRSKAPSILQDVARNCLNFSANRESMAAQGSSLWVQGGGGGICWFGTTIGAREDRPQSFTEQICCGICVGCRPAAVSSFRDFT